MSYQIIMCSEKDGLPAIARGLCQAHYRQWRLKKPLQPLRKHLLRPVKECSEKDGRPAVSNGFCAMHVLRWRRNGSLTRKDRYSPLYSALPEFPLPTNGTRDQWICWAAGFFDGEGSIGIMKDSKTRHYYLHLTVAQIDVASLQVLQGLFGGRINLREKRTEKRRAIHTWRLASQGARQVLEELLPFLIVKHRQAELAIELCNDTANRWGVVTDEEVARRENIRQAISRLNHGLPEVLLTT